MKKISLFSLSAGMVLALSLVSPGNARAQSGSWKDQLVSFGGSSDFDGGFGRDPAFGPRSLDRAEGRLERELLRDQHELTRDERLNEGLEELLHTDPFRYYSFYRDLERLIDRQISQLEAQIAALEKILSETH
jgi:hypothetical protein